MQLSIGQAIRARREARSWSQEQLGRAANGMNKETVNRAESGSNVTIDTLLRIAKALDVELELSLRGPAVDELATFRSVTYPVPGEDTVKASQGDSHTVLNTILPQTAVHLSLYGFIGDLTEEQARLIRRPLLDLIEKTQKNDHEKERKTVK